MTSIMENIITPFMPVFQNEKKNLSVRLPENRLFAFIDRNAFTKIMTNLLTNALKYSKTFVDLELFFSYGEDETFKVEIKNDGLLIPINERENIFKPFYRLKETETMQGSGIGLSLARSLAEFQDGSIIYKESIDQLNLFILTMPVRHKEYNFDLSDKPDEVTGDTSLPITSGKKAILIVEDQQDMRNFLIGELGTLFDVFEAGNGLQALKLLEEKSVDLIISDIMMPEMNGYELCNSVKNDVRFSHIPFILLTAQHNLQSRLTGLNQGADAYMEKPFSIEHLTVQADSLIKNRDRIFRAYLEKPLIPSSSLAISIVDKNFIEKLNTYIENNLTNDLNVNMLAYEMNMSNSSLYRKVKGISGLSPVDFIRIARLKKSIQLMQTGEKRISEIAYMVGISSPAYFSTLFQKQYGKTPKEFMKEL